MFTIDTNLGETTVTHVGMNRARGYGQYVIEIDYLFEGSRKTVRVHSTDSQLFDAYQDCESHDESIGLLLNRARYTIEEAVIDEIHAL